MRIIAGEFRGRHLLPPETDVTRAVTDRVKQSLFDILQPLMDGARVYDCFAGTGSMGLESLSRGAVQATFFEVDRSACKRLQSNITALGVVGRSTVVSTDLFQWFEQQPKPQHKADVVFLDPPYRFLRQRKDDLQRLAEILVRSHLSPDGLVVFRHDAMDELALPPLVVKDVRRYGGMTLEFLSATTQVGPCPLGDVPTPDATGGMH